MKFSKFLFVSRIFIFAITLLFSQVFGLENRRCGTTLFSDIQKGKVKKRLAEQNCTNDYGVVSERRTQNFIIYYVDYNAGGQHAIRSPYFIDSLALYLEDAYKLHKDSLGMKSISGARNTWHYRKTVPNNLYPVEVLDLGLLRNYEGEFAQAFGLTFPTTNDITRTQIAIENDFLYGADCQGNSSTRPFYSNINGNYSQRWNLALKVTAYHELYHSFQYTYSNSNWGITDSFWAEASATGVEAIGAPEVKDYISYLSGVFEDPGASMEEPVGLQEYGQAVLYLFLFHKLGAKFDSKIWDNFSKTPREQFSAQLEKVVKSMDENADPEDVFHEYAREVFFSGTRASLPQANIWWPDQQQWPLWSINNERKQSYLPPAIDFVRAYSGKVPSADSVARITILHYGNDSVWVLSSLMDSLSGQPSDVASKPKFAAFPNPWNPNKVPHLEFILPEPFIDVEIRSANGTLLDRIKGQYDGTAKWEPKRKIPPGILYYRTLPYGKNKVLIVEK